MAQKQGAPLSVGAISVYLGGEGEEYEAHVSEGASARGTSITFPLTREDREAIDFICGYIASNLGGDLSCSRLANQLYIGKTKLKNLFKTATGLSPSHYVAHERMEEAARLLAETDLAIAEIGEKVGYTKPGAFTEAFRRDRGCTPTQFRKQR